MSRTATSRARPAGGASASGTFGGLFERQEVSGLPWQRGGRRMSGVGE